MKGIHELKEEEAPKTFGVLTRRLEKATQTVEKQKRTINRLKQENADLRQQVDFF